MRLGRSGEKAELPSSALSLYHACEHGGSPAGILVGWPRPSTRLPVGRLVHVRAEHGTGGTDVPGDLVYDADRPTGGFALVVPVDDAVGGNDAQLRTLMVALMRAESACRADFRSVPRSAV